MNYRNARFNQFGTIDCEIQLQDGGEWMPATLREDTDNLEVIDLYHQALSDGEVLPYDAPVVSLDDLRKSKKAEIVSAYEKAMQSLVSDYPLKERETWRKQEEQARAFIADSQASTPGLDALATASGRDKAELANKIIEKAEALEVVSLALTGKKQALIQQIGEAVTVEVVNAVVWS